MKKVLLIVAMLLAVIALAAAGAVYWSQRQAAGPPADDRHPNILMVSIDTLRADHVSAYGYPKPTTPHLDQMAAEGARFARAISNCPWTLPSHITMFTGQEVGVHGIRTTNSALSPSALTIAKLLKTSGYRTMGIGSAPYLKAMYGNAVGFDSWDDELAQVSYKDSHEAVTAGKAVDKALHDIKANKDRRWFVFLHLWDVHYDYVPPPPYNKKFVDPSYSGSFPMHNWEKNRAFHVGMDPADFAYTLAQYDGEIAWVDSQLGRLLGRLREWGLDQRTIVLVTADHGEEFLEHGQKGHGHSLYDELIRVPLIVKGPRIPAGRVVECPVSLVDLLPTIAELGGVKKSPYDGPGRSLLPLLARADACDMQRNLFAETNMSNLDKLHNYKRGFEMMLEKGTVKFHNRVTDPMRELLFDVASDPGELNDRLAAEPEQGEAFKTEMGRYHHRNNNLRQKMRLLSRIQIDGKTQQQLKDLGYIQ